VEVSGPLDPCYRDPTNMRLVRPWNPRQLCTGQEGRDRMLRHHPAENRVRVVRVLTLLSVLLPTLVSGPQAAAAPPPAPTLLSPANGANVQVPFTISWSQVLDPSANNGGYNWQVSSSSTFSTLAAADSTFPSVTHATVSGLVARLGNATLTIAGGHLTGCFFRDLDRSLRRVSAASPHRAMSTCSRG